MDKYDNLTNNELSIMLVDIKKEHDIVKNDLILGLDKMDLLEKNFAEINNLIIKRLKG